MTYDVLIIGGGPGGIYTAWELLNKRPDLKLALFESGHTLERRRCPIDGVKVKSCVHCPTCAIMNGFGGAGAFSDAETQNDCVQVDHKGDVTVHFRAEVRPGYEKLAEVLKLRVSVGGSVLYDGLMAEMPAAVDTLLPAGSDTLDYQLTAYLDTSVGNPYMYQQLVADFYWWVADSEELAPPTGDTMQPLLWGAAVLVSGAALTVLLRRRREVSHD